MHGHIAAALVPNSAVVEAGIVVVGLNVWECWFHRASFRKNSIARNNSHNIERLEPFQNHHTVMQKLTLLLFLAGLLFVQPGCASWKQNRWLSHHTKTLKALAESNLPAEKKLDGLVQDYIQFMNEDLKFLNPVSGAKYVQKYHAQNERYIDKILKDSQKWQGDLNTLEKIELGVRVAKKPYINDLVDLVPKFKKKYKQTAFIVNLTSEVVGGLTGFLGKGLGI